MILTIYERRQSGAGNLDYYKIAKCQFHLVLPESTSELLIKLLNSETQDEFLIAYQIAFDLVDKEQQSFTSKVTNFLAEK